MEYKLILMYIVITLFIAYFMGLVMIYIIDKKLKLKSDTTLVEKFKSGKKKHTGCNCCPPKKKKLSSKKKYIEAFSKDTPKKKYKININLPLETYIQKEAKKLILDKFGLDVDKLDDDHKLRKYINSYDNYLKYHKKTHNMKDINLEGFNIGEYR